MRAVVISILSLILLVSSDNDNNDDDDHKSDHEFYDQLNQKAGINCCNYDDCRLLTSDRVRLTPTGWEVFTGERGELWTPLSPNTRIVYMNTPEGMEGAIACWRVPSYIVCFVPPPQA